VTSFCRYLSGLGWTTAAPAAPHRTHQAPTVRASPPVLVILSQAAAWVIDHDASQTLTGRFRPPGKPPAYPNLPDVPALDW
jgi:hypothetical protein